MTNGAGFITISQVPVIDLSPYATITYVNGLVGGLAIPTRTSDLVNNSGFIDINYLTWANISGKPNLFSGNYNDLTNKPFIPEDVSDLNNDLNFIDLSDLTWVNISGKPTLFSGDYDDLTNKPFIPSDTSDLTNGEGYITMAEVPFIPTELSELNNDAGYITIGDVPTNNNQLVNGAGYITMADVQPADIPIINSNTISFSEPRIYGSYSVPIFGPITFDLTDAKMGMIQEVYHEGSNMPTLPAGAKIVNDIEYSGTKVNLLLFKYTDNNRIEVVISVLEN